MITKNNRRVHDIYNSKNYPRIYKIWAGAKYRCNNPNANNYRYYGGRGITFCVEWNDFATFCKWSLDNGYADNLTLDRIDNSKGYCPENCRWVTILEQTNNRANNTNYTFDGETHTLAEWSRIFNVNYDTLLTRFANGKRGKELFSPTCNNGNVVLFEDIEYSDATLKSWTKKKLILYIHELYKIAEQLKEGGK